MAPTSPAGTARRIAFYLYVPLALAWILGTDLLVALSYAGLDRAGLLQMLKGAGFAAGTGTMLYFLIKRALVRREAIHRDLRTLAENVPDLIFRLRVRPQLAFEYVSPAAVRFAGYTPEEHYRDAQGVLDAVHPEDVDRFRALLTDVDAELSRVELRWVHKDGRTVWTEARVSQERDDQGRVIRVSGILRDMTAERSAAELRELLGEALEAAGEAVMITDRDGRIEYVNRAFTEITGYGAEEAVGRTPRLLRSGEQDDSFYSDLWSTIRSGRTFRGVMVNRRRDGRLYDQSTSITPIRGPDGAIAHFVSVGRDATVRRELERRLRHAEKMDAVGQLAAGVAHDFRNLLNVILVNVELLREPGEGSPETVAEEGAPPSHELAEIEAAARRGADLVGRLLSMARQPEPKARSLDLGALVCELEGMCRALVPESVALEVREGPEPVWAMADPSLIQDALLNLVANAGHATEAGGRILVLVDRGTDPDHPLARLVVRDTGAGMDEKTLGRIFDPFFTTKERGTGLGLPMVRGIVEQHGGTLDIASAVGQGTTVTVTLPEAVPVEDAAAAPEGVRGRSPTTPSPCARILFVDDDVRLRKAAERVLRRLGHEVTVAVNGREALEILERDPRRWDLVVSDLIMPELGGLELYQMVQERGWRLPFLFMSGHAPEVLTEAPVPERPHFFLEKPWTVDGLTARVAEALTDQRRTA